MGVVYYASHIQLEREAAIKFLIEQQSSKQEYIERFLREARAAARLNHSNIVTIYDAVVEDHRRYIIMEYVDGPHLGRLIKHKGIIDEDTALSYAQQAAEALSHAHSAQIIHRDVKPDNLLLTSQGRIKLCDLGLAKYIHNNSELTLSGTVVGTAFYISPEQIRGDKSIDGRADIYSLGATLYHLLTGQVPYRGKSSAETMSMHLTEAFPWPTQFNPALSNDTCRVLRKCMAKDPEQRFSSMEELCLVLNTLRRKEPIHIDIIAEPFESGIQLETHDHTQSVDPAVPKDPVTHAHEIIKNAHAPKLPKEHSSNLVIQGPIPALQPGARVFEDRFELQRLLGTGSNSIVWLASDTRFNRPRALKYLPPHVVRDRLALNGLKTQTQLVKCPYLHHPQFADIIDFLEDSTSAAICMEYIDGATLHELQMLQSHHIFDINVCMYKWITQLCYGLAYAHDSAKVAHTDIRPRNIMIDLAGDVKIMDCGINVARFIVSSTECPGDLYAGTWSDTDSARVFLSPQGVEGRRPSVLDDIYSVGATIYTLITSTPPFYVGDVYRSIMYATPPLMSERRRELGISGAVIPVAWEKMVAACLAKHPAQRPQSMHELALMVNSGDECAKKEKWINFNSAWEKMVAAYLAKHPAQRSQSVRELALMVNSGDQCAKKEKWINFKSVSSAMRRWFAKRKYPRYIKYFPHIDCLVNKKRASQYSMPLPSEKALRLLPSALGNQRNSAHSMPVPDEIEPLPFLCWLVVGDIEHSTSLCQALTQDNFAKLLAKWLESCYQIIDTHGGEINKFVGDGFLAFWHERPAVAEHVAKALEEIRAYQERMDPRFRLSLHYGLVRTDPPDSSDAFRERGLVGNEVDFIFRMERLASSLDRAVLISQAAASRLTPFISTKLLTCSELPGVSGKHLFFTL